MYVASIRIGKFRHLENVSLGPLREPLSDSATVVLAGPNGGGKSSILEVIGFGMANAWSLSWALHRNFPDYSFEIEFGLNDVDCSIIKKWLTEGSPSADDVEAANELMEDRRILRGFNYPEGESHRDSVKHNRLFRIATIALKDHYQRSIGLFLKPDRSYPVKAFDQGKLLQFDSLRAKSHVWSVAYNTSELQYQDMYDYLVQRRYHYFRDLGAYHHNEQLGKSSGVGPPTDPLAPYEELLDRLFSGYRFAPASEGIPQDLFVRIDDTTTLPFRDLSSGEKEVFFILASMLRHEVENAIIAVDEPELHLHPELARILVRELQSIKPGNQLWLATHNPEIIDEVGRDNVYYVARDRKSAKAIVVNGKDEPEANRILRDLFGFSGFIGVGRSIVFLEGTDTSADRKVFSLLVSSNAGRVKLVPAGGATTHTRLNAAVLKLMEADIADVNYYLVRDRDYLTDQQIAKYDTHASGRIRVLRRNEIENYLLVPGAITSVMSRIFNIEMTVDACQDALRTAAESISGEVVVGLTRAEIETRWQPEEVLPHRFLHGKPVLGEGADAKANLATLESALVKRASDLLSGLSASLAESEVRSVIASAVATADRWLNSDEWIDRFPGRRILETFARMQNLGDPVVLTNSIIREMASNQRFIEGELKKILSDASKGRPKLSS